MNPALSWALLPCVCLSFEFFYGYSSKKDDALRRSHARLVCVVCFGLRCFHPSVDDSYLVDPASSHMLVSKIKPCMSKFTLSHGETANGSLNQSRFLR